MLRILSVSYDSALLTSRDLLLKSRGYQVVSISRFNEALEHCNRSGAFDVFILGHSIPLPEKQLLVSTFRAGSLAPIVALKRYGEESVAAADLEIDPDPDKLLEVVSKLVSRTPASRRARA